MIAYLSGVVEFIDSPYIIINVQGVGYKVLATASILRKNTAIGSSLRLFTYTHVREDALDLYGFEDYQDLKLFEAMTSVSGIGPKTAIGIFSIGSSLEIIQAIKDGNSNYFMSAPRLGKKNAQKLIIELRSKLGSKEEFLIPDEATINGDLELANVLKNFGFNSSEIQKAIKGIGENTNSLEDKIKEALRSLGK